MPEPSRSYKVLVVEDEGLIAHDIAQRIQSLGHDALGPVSTADEAIAAAAGADIILMDIRIDGARDGIDAALEIRARHHLPVIFLTAHADRATLERAKQAGPFGYIVKPLGPASLQTGIEMAIAKHRVERLLEEREAWLRAAIASIADAAVVTGADGRVRLLNRAAERLTGWRQTDAEGQHAQRVIRLLDTNSQEEFDFVPVALLRDAPVEFPRGCRLLARDGRELEIEGSVAPVRLSEELLGAVMTFRDASARHWEERQLRQSQRLEAAGRLAAGAANEYTTLVSLIRKQADQLLLEFGEYSPAHTPLEDIRQAAAAADQITRRLAAFGTRQVGQPEVLSLNSLLRRMARLIESAAGQNIRVAIRPTPGAGRIKADTAQMESAIMSLVTHACSSASLGASESTPGQLLIETARVELPHVGRLAEYVLLAVTYSGVEPDIERLFDPGSTADAGLALAGVHSVAVECGGYLSARSAFDGGSRVEMLIPRIGDQALLTGAAAAARTELGFAPSILLVDGSSAVRAELHNFFESAGYNLLEAASVSEAVALAEMHDTVDLVVAEDRECSSILRQLRGAHPSLEALRIVDTPENGPGEIRRPFTLRTLLERVTALLARASAAVTSSSAI